MESKFIKIARFYLFVLMVFIHMPGHASEVVIGQVESTSSSADWDEFLSSDLLPNHVVSSGDMQTLRPWIGHSECGSCTPGTYKKQRMTFNNLVVGRTYRLDVYPAYVSGTAYYSALVSGGTAQITQGAQKYFTGLQGYLNSSHKWTISFVPQTNSVSLDLGHGLTSGTHYLYINWYKFVPPINTQNVLQTQSGAIKHIYQVSDPGASNSYVYFEMSNGTVSAYDENENTLWSQYVGSNTSGALFGGFDFDSDGWTDVGIVRVNNSSQYCGPHLMTESYITFIRGKTGQLVGGLSPLLDYCFDQDANSSNWYPVQQWVSHAVYFGKSNPALFLSPQYATNSWFFTFNGSSFTSDYLIYPSTSDFNFYYTNAQANPFGAPVDSHTANGLFVPVPGGERLLFFTSGRVLQYDIEAFNSGQLVYDYTFLSGGITDHSGRNYGLVSVDPNYSNVALISGAGAISLYQDTLNGTMQYDRLGGLARHVTVYNYLNNSLSDKFYSYESNSVNGPYLYENRVVHPANPFIKVGANQPSRIAYNVYAQGHWYMHISYPGSTQDRYALADVFVWDIRDIDGDGVDEIIASPTRWSTEPNVPGYYYSKFHTNIYHWDEANESLTNIKSYSGLIPNLTNRFREPLTTSTNSSGFLTPVQVLNQNGVVKLVLRNSSSIQVVNY